MEVEVSFIYDASTSTIKDFKSIDRCINGSGGIEWVPVKTIGVKKDGSFYFKHVSGNFIKGSIIPGGMATGEFGPHFVFAHPICVDGKSYPKCTIWHASPAK